MKETTGTADSQNNGGKNGKSGNANADDMVEIIIGLEWNQFQHTNNEGGRASCQGNWPMFHQMRASQFLTWPAELLSSYQSDLHEADRTGRNLVTEKYGRMMQSTYPQEYCANIEPYIPRLSDNRMALQERVIATQVAWARDFRLRWPKLGMAMRVLTTDEDSPQATSFETYLRGELGTYSERTIALYADFISRLEAEHRNLTEETIRNTVRLAGFEDLDDAEAAQR